MPDTIVVDETAVQAAIQKERETQTLHDSITANSTAASMLSRATRVQTFTWTCSYCPNTLVLQAHTSMMAGHQARLLGWTYTKTAVVCPGCDLL